SAALSANGQVLVTRSIDQTLRVWDTSTGRQFHRLTAPTNREPVGEIQASSVAISPDGKTLAWIGWRRNNDLMIHVCNVATGKELLALQGDERGTYRVAFSPDGRALASVAPVRIWDLKTGKQIPTYQDKHNFDSCYLIWTPDGKPLVSSQFSAPPIRLVDAATGKELCRVAADIFWRGMTFSPNGKTLALYYGQSDRTIHRYGLVTGKELVDSPGHGGIVMGLAFSSDGLTLASVGRDELRLWDVNTGKQFREIPGVKAWVGRAISSDCRLLAAAT